MKIEEVRTSFTVYVVASKIEDFEGMAESLGMAGYMVANFSELTAAFSELYSNPPHFLILDAQEKAFDLGKAMQQVSSQLPESHIFLVTPFTEREKAVGLLEQGVYDLIFTPLVSPVELVRTLDRAAERDYFMYLNERLMQSQSPEPTSTEISPGTSLFDMTVTGMNADGATKGTTDDFHLNYAHRLFAQNTADECLSVFLELAAKALGTCPAIYFRYIANRRVLVATQSQNVTDVDLTGTGMNFNDSAAGFRTAQLRDPLGVEPFCAMIRDIFEVKDFVAVPVESLGEIQGIVCFLTPMPSAALTSMIGEWLTLLNKALSLVESEKRLHVVSIKDLSTDVLNRATFMTKVSEEISRARRTQMPVSLVQIAIDQYGQLTSNFGAEEAQIVMRTAARILEKHSRVNDIVGRTGADEFGLLLPHTSKQGAMVKGERLRRIFESADFDKVLKGFKRLTISLGVSEYPSLARDSEELIQSADEALYQVRATGNKTCVGKAPEGFEPDFRIAEKGS